jgi:hypothetical protein
MEWASHLLESKTQLRIKSGNGQWRSLTFRCIVTCDITDWLPIHLSGTMKVVGANDGRFNRNDQHSSQLDV